MEANVSPWLKANNIGNILMRQGAMTRKQIDLVAAEQEKRKANGIDIVFGELAKEMGLCTEADIATALKVQAENLAPASNEAALEESFERAERAVDSARTASRQMRAATFALCEETRAKALP